MTSHLSTDVDMFSQGLNHNNPQIHWLSFPRAYTVPTSTGSSFPGFHSYPGYPTTCHLAAQRTLKALNHQRYLGSPQKHHWRNSRFRVAPGFSWPPGRHWGVERSSVSGAGAQQGHSGGPHTALFPGLPPPAEAGQYSTEDGPPHFYLHASLPALKNVKNHTFQLCCYKHERVCKCTFSLTYKFVFTFLLILFSFTFLSR